MKTMNVEQILNDNFEGRHRTPDDPKQWLYRVVKVTNSITPQVGQLLDPPTCRSYCDNNDWNVAIF